MTKSYFDNLLENTLFELRIDTDWNTENISQKNFDNFGKKSDSEIKKRKQIQLDTANFLWSEYYTKGYAYLFKRLTNREDIEDLCSLIMTKFLDKVLGFDENYSDSETDSEIYLKTSNRNQNRLGQTTSNTYQNPSYNQYYNQNSQYTETQNISQNPNQTKNIKIGNGQTKSNIQDFDNLTSRLASQGINNLTSYFFQICRNQLTDYLRKKQRIAQNLEIPTDFSAEESRFENNYAENSGFKNSEFYSSDLAKNYRSGFDNNYNYNYNHNSGFEKLVFDKYSLSYLERISRLQQCIHNQLDSQSREVIEVMIVCEKSSQEASLELNLKPENIRQILSRSIKKLKKHCSQVWQE